jgi:uncharacterized protein YjlB
MGSTPTPEVHVFADDGLIPNSRLGLLVYRRVRCDLDAQGWLALLAANGWGDGWVNGIYRFHHYHSTSHEVLGCFRGWVDVRFGGESGRTMRLEAGDAVVIPAGVGHCNRGDGGGFGVVGAYPAGQGNWDLCRGRPGERPGADDAIARVSMPEHDPLMGADGPLARLWRD